MSSDSDIKKSCDFFNFKCQVTLDFENKGKAAVSYG